MLAERVRAQTNGSSVYFRLRHSTSDYSFWPGSFGSISCFSSFLPPTIPHKRTRTLRNVKNMEILSSIELYIGKHWFGSFIFFIIGSPSSADRFLNSIYRAPRRSHISYALFLSLSFELLRLFFSAHRLSTEYRNLAVHHHLLTLGKRNLLTTYYLFDAFFSSFLLCMEWMSPVHVKESRFFSRWSTLPLVFAASHPPSHLNRFNSCFNTRITRFVCWIKFRLTIFFASSSSSFFIGIDYFAPFFISFFLPGWFKYLCTLLYPSNLCFIWVVLSLRCKRTQVFTDRFKQWASAVETHTNRFHLQ